ncbi:MAG: UDP-N-acetylmuramoyl-tripeptide--D-alanyl-D-alanine ligase, partial [Nitrospirae bacterium]|nr:UDP-N-acetylmuramoyl-tripeptide--D-alanyl-D-alanine ligase [Nitrospirota bacterium]
KGDRCDGHAFLDKAMNKGEGAVISRMPEGISNWINLRTIIVVEDVLKALQDLAGHLRRQFNGRVIGVVGSNGKTTTKELISSIFNIKMTVHKTSGNFNNHIGMPLSIIRSGQGGVMALEMGANKPGDIDELCAISRPDAAVITNIGYEHIEGFGSIEKVRESELEILPYINRAIVNGDDGFLLDGVRDRFDREIIKFGIEADAEVKAREIKYHDSGTRFVLCAGDKSTAIDSRLLGRFNVYNCLAAASAAYAEGFDVEEIKVGIESFKGIDKRFEIKRLEGITFLNDSYNANPSSMEESIKELIRFSEYSESGRRKYKRAIAVLGDMLELGDYGITAHKRLGQMLSKAHVDIFIGVGPLMSFAVKEFTGEGLSVKTSDDARVKVQEIIQEGDVVLIKGSRGMKMERAAGLAAGGEL